MKTAAFLLFVVATVFSGAPAVVLGVAAVGAVAWLLWR